MQFGLKSNNRVSTPPSCSVVQQATWMAEKFVVKDRKEKGLRSVNNMVSTTLRATAWQLRFLPRMSVWYTGYQCGTAVVSVVHRLSVWYTGHQCGTMVISVVHSVVLLDVSLTQFAYIECTSVVIFHCVSITMCKHQCVSASVLVPVCQYASVSLWPQHLFRTSRTHTIPVASLLKMSFSYKSIVFLMFLPLSELRLGHYAIVSVFYFLCLSFSVL